MSDQMSLAEQKPEINPQQASIILQLLQRAQMQGAEMPAYVDVFNTLSAIVATVPQELAEGQKEI